MEKQKHIVAFIFKLSQDYEIINEKMKNRIGHIDSIWFIFGIATLLLSSISLLKTLIKY